MRLSRLALKVFLPAVFVLAMPASAAISLSTTTPQVQPFNIGTSATASLPADFKVDRLTTVRTAGSYAAATTATALTGGGNLSSTAQNGIYNFGAGTDALGSDRAIGFLSAGTGTQSGNLYAQYVNATGANLSGLKISYDVEKYRNGSNPNGFRIQMFYSLDGTSWTSAGADFLTSFGPNTSNAGFPTAPGATVPVTDKTLSVTIANGGNIYLAWNYSVSATTTTTNAQALAIDNISVLGLGGGGSTNPSGTGSANPATITAGGTTLLTVNVTPGTTPESTALNVSANLTSIGGSSNQLFFAGANNVFTFSATVTSTTSPGNKTLPVTISDGEGRLGNTSINLVVEQPVGPVDHVVISQVYGGGGNSGAPYQSDFVELYNPSTTTFNLRGWSLQYTSSGGSSWGFNNTITPLGGTIAPGEYYLVKLSTGSTGQPLPMPNANGETSMAAGSGKVALVSNSVFLTGACPLDDPDVVDLVGYGTSATCSEGNATTANLSNTTAALRKNAGAQDTNNNGADFTIGVPNPRRTAPFAEFGPSILETNPAFNAANAPRDASIEVNFSEAVDVSSGWFTINCASSGEHTDVTIAGGPRNYVIIPNENFRSAEQCSVTIFKDFVRDQDLDDSEPGTDTLAANVTWTFTVATGTAPPFADDVHIIMGNPSGAIPDVREPNNYLMMKPEFALSYSRDRGAPNWVSWHLSDEWVGSLTRVDTFRPDPAVPRDWYRVLGSDFSGSGFDRGHMVPNADRDKETSIPINQATFLMSNMLAQAPGNNQGPWANMENFLRTLLPANEVYIVAGGAGAGGVGANGFAMTIANGRVTVPAQTWKVAVVLPKGEGDVSRVAADTRTIAVIMPNIDSIRSNPNNPSDWMSYLVPVDQVESLTGYDFFANVSDAVENAIEAGVNGTNPPGAANQSVSTAEDESRSFTFNVASTASTLTYTIVTQPVHGTLAGSGSSQTYTPAVDFNGTDTFTYRVSDGVRTSNVATVTITVLEANDDPIAAIDSKSTDEDTSLTFAAADLIVNDAAGPANENGQTLTVSSVSASANTFGSVAFANGQITYTPQANFHGSASFTYQVCDNGITAGLTTPKCATSTVNIVVNSVNDAPSATINTAGTGIEGSPLAITASTADPDANDTLTFAWSVTRNGAPYGPTATSASFSFTPDDNGSYVVSLRVTDGSGAFGDASATVAVSNVAPIIVSLSGPSSATQAGAATSIMLLISDAGAADTHVAAFTWDDGSSSIANCAAGICTASHMFASAGVYTVAIVVTDDDGGAVSSTFASVVVVEPAAGFVTGGGFVEGPAGKTIFNVGSNYVKTDAPSGNTQLKAPGFDFDATSQEWLVVAGNTAQYKGEGTVNRKSGYGFIVTVVDGETDKVRFRIWEKATGTTMFDNAPGAADDIDIANPQPISSGNITVHTSR